HVPGHTPADMAYCVEGLGIFIGDTLFMPDVGTARCDFPGGDAHALYQSIQRILALGDDTRLYLCHDYPPDCRGPQCCVTVREQRAGNIHVRDGIGAQEFVAMRTARDKTLAMPSLILPAIQVNIRAGRYPEPEDNGVRYLKIPLNQF
ncbi:MAG: MBL fold metallo-hydrolase, partial [Pollutimonas bauzanensis]